MRIRCSGCSKKISVDDAFAGGVCRCPYCKDTVFVPGKAEEGKAKGRPDAPGRPDVPTAAEGGEEVLVGQPLEAHVRVPMARPVVVQGIVSIILCGLLIVLIGGGIVFGAVMAASSIGGDPNTARQAGPVDANNVNPFLVDGGGQEGADQDTMAGLPITPPVVYVIENDASLRRSLDLIYDMVVFSVKTLEPREQFSVILTGPPPAGHNGKRAMDGWAPGGEVGMAEAERFFNQVDWLGASDVPAAFMEALARKPRTVVLCAAGRIENPGSLASAAKAASVSVVAVGITPSEANFASLAELARLTGGRSRQLTGSQLASFLEALYLSE